MNVKKKKLVNVDLDGVLNTYHGNYDPIKISPPREGVHEFLKNLSEHFIVDVFTPRDKNLVIEWLKEQNLYQYINDVTNIKNKYSTVTLDDRAVNFDGDFSKAFKKMLVFEPFWK